LRLETKSKLAENGKLVGVFPVFATIEAAGGGIPRKNVIGKKFMKEGDFEKKLFNGAQAVRHNPTKNKRDDQSIEIEREGSTKQEPYSGYTGRYVQTRPFVGYRGRLEA